MKQQRLSIGCQDWQETIKRIGPTAAAVYLYLRTLMRGMQAAEITVMVPELAEAVGMPREAAEGALRAILAAGYFTACGAPAAGASTCTEVVGSACRASDDLPDDSRNSQITLFDPKEAAAQADMFRKRAARLLSKNVCEQSRRQPQPGTYPGGQSAGQSGVCTGNTEDLNSKSLHTDFFMIYSGPSGEEEKAPRTPQKEESLTEIQTHARSNKTCEQPELPSDSLEAEYIEICGSWPETLRAAVRAEKEEVREAFYLFIRQKRKEDPVRWGIDRTRIAWLAARRIPEERRADSILAAAMGDWKTIRDCGSGVYFEKETGRVVSLVRGTVEARPKQNETERSNMDLAVRLARNIRRS